MKTILQFVISLSIIVHMVFAWLMVDSFFNGRLTTDAMLRCGLSESWSG